MLRSCLAFASFLFFATPVFAESDKPNTVSFELLGRGLLYSINYDRAITPELTVGGGLSAWRAEAHDDNNVHYDSANIFIIPLYVDYYLYNQNNHRWFVTGGIDIVSARFNDSGYKYSDGGLAVTGGGGYEYRADNGFVFRGAMYLLIGGGEAHIWPGISGGYNF